MQLVGDMLDLLEHMQRATSPSNTQAPTPAQLPQSLSDLASQAAGALLSLCWEASRLVAGGPQPALPADTSMPIAALAALKRLSDLFPGQVGSAYTVPYMAALVTQEHGKVSHSIYTSYECKPT